jgi:hypothetical protein
VTAFVDVVDETGFVATLDADDADDVDASSGDVNADSPLFPAAFSNRTWV